MESISEQVKELRELAEDCKCENEEDEVVRQLQYAADTIEYLSKKSGRRKVENCGGGWIICNKYNLPKEDGKYWITYFWSGKGCVELCSFREGKFIHGAIATGDVYAWMPCIFPEPCLEYEP